MELTFPSVLAVVCVCEGKQGQFFRKKVKLSASVFLYLQISFTADRPTLNLYQEEVSGP